MLYENYYKLLFTILYSDYKGFDKSLIFVYDITDGERLVAIFDTVKRCSEVFGLTRGTVSTYLSKNMIIRSKFKFERFYVEEEIE
ncbi:MAG: hypothetical protein SPJ27_09085 [Candidatus Onthovivens sp.]|nr:hypothetical protein [Candidatus Onthovivens sp.]